MAIEKIARFLVGILPDRLAILVVRAMVRTQRPPMTPPQQQALAQASQLRYGENQRNVAWSWGEGPLVILVHGWNGRAAHLAPLAVSIAKLGFRCVAIEVTGHGSSPGNRTGWACFIEDIAALTRSLDQDVHAYVAHSAGGLTTMATRSLKGIRAKLYVCICAPSHPFPPINVIRKRLDLRSGVIDLYREFIARQFNTGWDTLESGCSYAGAGPDLLLFYDEADRFVDHTEGDRILKLCPGARLIKSNRYGHTKVLGSPELLQAVSGFLTNGEVSPDPHDEPRGEIVDMDRNLN
jgi:pimeloyl-ACP methyl ester carboxylesterase